jgi:anti-sigma factor RsiW
MTQPIQNTGHLQPVDLNAFVDGELPPADSRNIQQHLEACHRCALRVVTANQIKAATARAGERFAPSAETLGRLTAALRPQDLEQTRPSARVLPRYIAAWSVLAAALLLTISLVGWRQVRQSDALAAELLDQHLAMLSSGNTPQVLSTDRHTVKPWFQGRLPFSFNLPEADALPPDTTLRGADLVYLEGRPAALLIFSIHKHEASVFLTPRSSPFALPPRSTRSGFTVRCTTAAELRLMAVSDVNPTELDALVKALAKVQ